VSTEPERNRLTDADPYADTLEELPPNIPPGFLGEHGPDFRKVDGDGSHGLNAGVIQEWTWETTMIAVAIAYLLFFPAAYVILWRARKVPRRQQVVLTVAMTIGLGLVAVRLLS
jgi:hypothetical protein